MLGVAWLDGKNCPVPVVINAHFVYFGSEVSGEPEGRGLLGQIPAPAAKSAVRQGWVWVGGTKNVSL